MKAFWISVAAMAVITVGAALVLSSVNMSAERVYSSTRGDVRL